MLNYTADLFQMLKLLEAGVSGCLVSNALRHATQAPHMLLQSALEQTVYMPLLKSDQRISDLHPLAWSHLLLNEVKKYP